MSAWGESIGRRAFTRVPGLVLAGAGTGPMYLSWYDAAGAHLGALPMPAEARGFPLVWGNRVALHGSGPVLHLVDLDSGVLRRASIDRPGEERTEWAFGVSPDGAELWAVSSRTLRLYRFAVAP